MSDKIDIFEELCAQQMFHSAKIVELRKAVEDERSRIALTTREITISQARDWLNARGLSEIAAELVEYLKGG